MRNQKNSASPFIQGVSKVRKRERIFELSLPALVKGKFGNSLFQPFSARCPGNNSMAGDGNPSNHPSSDQTKNGIKRRSKSPSGSQQWSKGKQANCFFKIILPLHHPTSPFFLYLTSLILIKYDLINK